MTDQEIFQKAIEKWGSDDQIEMIIEECSELILALQKLKRGYGEDFAINEELLYKVCDEVADVKIMTRQADLLFDKKLIDSRVAYKMKRLEDRVK